MLGVVSSRLLWIMADECVLWWVGRCARVVFNVRGFAFPDEARFLVLMGDDSVWWVN